MQPSRRHDLKPVIGLSDVYSRLRSRLDKIIITAGECEVTGHQIIKEGKEGGDRKRLGAAKRGPVLRTTAERYSHPTKISYARSSEEGKVRYPYFGTCVCAVFLRQIVSWFAFVVLGRFGTCFGFYCPIQESDPEIDREARIARYDVQASDWRAKARTRRRAEQHTASGRRYAVRGYSIDTGQTAVVP